jgi:glycosyltransferase involved in cell wall biosynthesis
MITASSTPEISVIIPAYNRADLIVQALDSVFAQTYKNFEIIVVDDGSTDNTAEVLRPLAEQGSIRYIHQPNRGVSAARNLGIREAQGNLIAFLDSDDLFEANKLELQVEYITSHPEVGLAHSGFTKFDDDGNDLGYRDTSWFSGTIYPDILLYWTTIMAVDTVLIPKQVLDDVGLFNETLHIGEDMDLWRRISRKYSFGCIAQSLTRVRVHAGNASSDKMRATNGFIKYLDRAFEDDPSLPATFKRRVYSKMFSMMAYNLLGEQGNEAIHAARSNATRAIMRDPFNPHGYIALASTFIGYNFRYNLVRYWRYLRSWLMSKNRAV